MARSNSRRRVLSSNINARRSLPTQRFVPYGVQQKKFRRFAPNYNSSRGERQNAGRSSDRGFRFRVVRGLSSVSRTSSPSRWTDALKRIRTSMALSTDVVKNKGNKKSVCASRSERKEVMHATGKAGRVGQKSPVWTLLSRRRCK